MIPKRIDGDTSHFRIFAARIVACDERLHFVPQGIVHGMLSGDGRPSLRLSASSLGQGSPRLGAI
jgi:hypothetical protein